MRLNTFERSSYRLSVRPSVGPSLFSEDKNWGVWIKEWQKLRLCTRNLFWGSKKKSNAGRSQASLDKKSPPRNVKQNLPHGHPAISKSLKWNVRRRLFDQVSQWIRPAQLSCDLSYWTHSDGGDVKKYHEAGTDQLHSQLLEALRHSRTDAGEFGVEATGRRWFFW